MQRQPRRSALLTCPGGEVPRQPTVAVVVPLFNESKWVREAVSGVLRQDYPNLREIWLVDGRSTDGTRQQLEEVKARDPRIRVADNPLRVQAAALNIALERTSCDLIMRIDAHAIFAPGAVSQSVSLLLSTGAAVAGPVMHVHSGHGVWEAAIKSALDSALGAGVARFHRANAHGWADTAWCGCYWRHVLLEVGPWREDLPRTEDNNMNARVREAGYGVFLSNTIQAWYTPRPSLPGLAKQYFLNGKEVTRTCRRNPAGLSLRHFMPTAFLTILLVTLVIHLFGVSPLPLTFLLAWYSLTLLAATVLTFSRCPGYHALLLPIVIVTIHLCYGVGGLRGLLTLGASSTIRRPSSKR